MTLRRWHRLTALVLGAFLALHLGNHLAGLAGQEAHRASQELFRHLYRNPLIEPLLLALFVLQIGLGLALALRQKRLTVQSAAGLYLAIFILIHLGAVLAARWQGVETDLAFAAAGLHAAQPWPVMFALYYGLAVLALGIHVATALGRRQPGLARLVLASGLVIAALILGLLAGWITPLTIPPALIAQFPTFGP